ALELAAQGCHLAISDVSEETLAETKAQLASAQVQVSTHVVDVADREAMFAFADDVVKHHGKVNLIFNNAGVSVTDSVEHMRLEDFEWLMNTNFWGVGYGTQAFLPQLQKADAGHIVNTASIFGVVAMPSQSAYNASKFAVRGFTESLRQELADSRIGVTCVQPGGVKTNIVKTSRYYPRDNEAPTRDEAIASFEAVAALAPPEAARIILRGVQRNRCRVLVGKDAWLMATLQRLMPERYPQAIAWVANRLGPKDDGLSKIINSDK
ncbi:MAG: SDR family NAD(P)-dependent oxidoreductase, partial [Pseudomonadales bacterium]